MWFVFELFLVSFISALAIFGSLGSDNQWPGLILASIGWFLFIGSLSGSNRIRRRQDKENEQLIEELLNLYNVATE